MRQTLERFSAKQNMVGNPRTPLNAPAVNKNVRLRDPDNLNIERYLSVISHLSYPVDCSPNKWSLAWRPLLILPKIRPSGTYD
jgi:hypothetical protein